MMDMLKAFEALKKRRAEGKVKRGKPPDYFGDGKPMSRAGWRTERKGGWGNPNFGRQMAEKRKVAVNE